jgi:hypothetical protein
MITEPTKVLPDGVRLFVRTGQERVERVDHVSLIEADGFERIQSATQPPGWVRVALFGKRELVDAFYAGFRASSPDDDISYCIETIKVGRRTIYAFLAVDGDADGEFLQILNFLGN